ncbi:hypothetical protein L7F22_007688, partial [Adiantum nelumboides]|nr:hypothetical protein [Adiantum nelumboides]
MASSSPPSSLQSFNGSLFPLKSKGFDWFQWVRMILFHLGFLPSPPSLLPPPYHLHGFLLVEHYGFKASFNTKLPWHATGAR